LQDCIAMANPLAEMKESSIQLKIPERILWVNASPLQVARIFDNLIRNAIIHNPKRTTILVEARSRAHVHQISIADNGAGISQDKLEHIFDKEYAESFRTTEGEGMGLQIVKSFVEAMGGKISLKSEAGCGTTFTVSLPSGHIEPGGESQEAGEELYSSGRQFLPKESLVTASSIENRGPEHD
jgi:signal transduction histidine kinase